MSSGDNRWRVAAEGQMKLMEDMQQELSSSVAKNGQLEVIMLYLFH